MTRQTIIRIPMTVHPIFYKPLRYLPVHLWRIAHARRIERGVIVFFLSFLLLTPIEAQRETGLVSSTGSQFEVTTEAAKIQLGDSVLGYLEKGTKLHTKKSPKDGYYLIEVMIDGRFRSLGWIAKEDVRKIDASEEGAATRKESGIAYAFPTKEKLQKGERNENPAQKYRVTGYYDSGQSKNPALEQAGIEKRNKASENSEPVEEYREQMPDKEGTGKSVTGLEEVPDHIDPEKGAPPEEKPKDPVVAKEPLPQVENPTEHEQTLGRGTKEMNVTTQQKIAGVIMALVVVGLFSYILFFDTSGNRRSKKRRR